jgi:hypothetical protein
MTNPILPPKRSRLRFSLRTLFIAMTVLFVVVGVTAQRLHRRHVVNETIWQHRGVGYGEYSKMHERIEDVFSQRWWDGPIVGVKFINGTDATDDDLTVLNECPNLKELVFNYCQNITDKTLFRLCSHNRCLEAIRIYNCPHITEAGILALSDMPKMRLMGINIKFKNDNFTTHLKDRNITATYTFIE